MYSVSGWMALRWLIAGQPGERFDPKWLFLLSLSFLSVWGDNFNLIFFFFAFVERCTWRSAAAVTVSSVALSLLGNVPRRRSGASQPQKHMSYPLGKSGTQIHTENKDTLHYMLETGIHSWLLMEISAIRLKRKGFNAQRKEAKAMKVLGLKKPNKITKQVGTFLLHYIGKCNVLNVAFAFGVLLV